MSPLMIPRPLAPRVAAPFPLVRATGWAAAVALGALLFAAGASPVEPRDGFGRLVGSGEGTAVVLLLAGAAAALAGAGLLARPTWVLGALVILPPLAPPLVNAHPLDLGAAKVYFYDVLIVLFAGAVALRVAGERGGAPLFARRPPLLLPLAAMLAMGTLQLARALVMGLDFNDAFGDFRRGMFYLLAYLFPFLLPAPRRTVRALEAIVLASAGLLVVRGLGEATLGRFERTMVLDAAHILRHFELVVVTTLAYYAVARLLIDPPERRRAGAMIALFVMATLVVLLGNFRAVWLGFVGGAALLLLVLPLRFRVAALALAVVGLLGVLAVFLVLRDVEIDETGRTLQQEVALKVERFRDRDRDKNVIWRYQSYAAALESWSRHPWLGAGLGVKSTFFVLRSDGSIGVASRHRTHNSYLWVLHTVGIVGIAFFLAFHLAFLLRAAGRLRRLLRERGTAPPIALALLGFYGAFMTTTAFDVLLEESIPILWLVIAMATADLALLLAEEEAPVPLAAPDAPAASC